MKRFAKVTLAVATMILPLALVVLAGCGWFDGGTSPTKGGVVLLQLTPLASTRNVFTVGLYYPDGSEADGLWEIQYEVTQGAWTILGSRETQDTLVIPITLDAAGVEVQVSHSVVARRGAVTSTLATAAVPF